MAKAIRLTFLLAAAAAECVKQIVGLRENSHTTCSVIKPSLLLLLCNDCCAAIYTMLFSFLFRMNTINDKAVSIQPSTTFVKVCALRIIYLAVSLCIDGMCPFPHGVSVSLCVCACVKLGDCERVDMAME